MKGDQSFDRINYLLRTNKHIERKLIFDALLRVHGMFNLYNHRYIGFGSMWFGDFLLVHRLIGIKDMWSIELEKNSKRADFNKPYMSIQVKSGRSSEILKEITEEEWKKPCIAWLDYDGVFDADVISDIDTLIRKLAAMSFVLFTVNGNRLSYKMQIDSGRRSPALQTITDIAGPINIPSRCNYGKTGAGELIDIPERDFPKILAESILNVISHKMSVSGRYSDKLPIRFLPLFNFCHVDGTEMVTVGGAIVKQSDVNKLCELLPDFSEIDSSSELPVQICLDLVQLTVKEKMVLDGVLPNLESEFEEIAKMKGIELPDDQLKKYWNCYRYFPVFTEAFF